MTKLSKGRKVRGHKIFCSNTNGYVNLLFYTKKPVRYVHELQHAFVEAGIDKEIILDD